MGKQHQFSDKNQYLNPKKEKNKSKTQTIIQSRQMFTQKRTMIRKYECNIHYTSLTVFKLDFGFSFVVEEASSGTNVLPFF